MDLQTRRPSEKEVTFSDILGHADVSSHIISFLRLGDKCRLRLVNRKAKAAVDATVLAVDIYCKTRNEVSTYIQSLACSNWKMLQKISIRGAMLKSADVIALADAGLSKLEVLNALLDKSDDTSADRVVEANWKLKYIERSPSNSTWLQKIVQGSQWQLEHFHFTARYDQKVDDVGQSLFIISQAKWPLKSFKVYVSNDVGCEPFEQLMTASWIKTLEELTIEWHYFGPGCCKALAAATLRGFKLKKLEFVFCKLTIDGFLLAEGTYDELQTLILSYRPFSIEGLAAWLKKCTSLETLEMAGIPSRRTPGGNMTVEEARLLADAWPATLCSLDMTNSNMTNNSTIDLFSNSQWPSLKRLNIGYIDVDTDTSVYNQDLVITMAQSDWYAKLESLCLYGFPHAERYYGTLFERQWPALKELTIYAYPELMIEPAVLPNLAKLTLWRIQHYIPIISESVWPQIEWLGLHCDGNPLDFYDLISELDTRNLPHMDEMHLDGTEYYSDNEDEPDADDPGWDAWRTERHNIKADDFQEKLGMIQDWMEESPVDFDITLADWVEYSQSYLDTSDEESDKDEEQ